jgi:DNA-binding transcriptional LysR family regulator
MDPLDGVTVFVTVAQCGGFSAAAEKLGCSKSTISAQITRLERRIGARLLRRSSRSVSLTDAGRAYLCQVDDVLDRVRQAEKAAQAEANEPRGLLRVSAPSPFAWTHLAPLLPEFMARHPDITIELQVTAEVVDLVTAGFDLAIRLCPTSDPNIIVRRLGGTRLVVAASPDLVRHCAIPRIPEDLMALPLLVNSLHPWRDEWRFRRGTTERLITVRPRLVADSLDVLHHLVRAGTGAALLSEYAIMADLDAGRLIRLLADWQVIDIPVLAVYPDNRHIAAKVRTFVAFLARRLEPGALMQMPNAEQPLERPA